MDTQVLRGKDQSRWQQTRNRYCHPTFGYKNHIAIDARFGFIRSYAVTNAAKHDGKVLRDIVTRDNASSRVWADTAYRSRVNEQWLINQPWAPSHIHHKKPRGKAMPANIARGNATKSRIRAQVEHVFDKQKSRMGLFIRTWP